MSVTLEVSHPVMFSLNELELKTTPPHQDSALHVANTYYMSVTRLVSHLGISSHPAAPHRAELGSAQFGSVEQQLAPEVTFPKQFLIAVLSASLSANGAASAAGMRVHHTTHNAINARDREIRIPRARSTPGRSRRCVPSSTRVHMDQP